MFQVGAKRTASKPSGDQPQQDDELTIDWSAAGKLPVKFRYWDYDLALDWSANGVPEEATNLIKKAGTSRTQQERCRSTGEAYDLLSTRQDNGRVLARLSPVPC